jgi:S-adenosylmethionine hydrolase
MSARRATPIIALLTDFGLRDHFVGVMKGVIASIAPEARVVDVTHEVEPYRVAQARFLLAQSWPYFPAGTIHVAVVDPGVGSARRPIVVRANGHVFVGPDNGLLGDLLEAPRASVREITNRRLMLPEVSSTFHGRDVFAPVAAHLATGVAPARVGPLIHDAVPGSSRAVQASACRWSGEIVHVDRFGNLITNLPAACVQGEALFTLRTGRRKFHTVAPSYSALAPGTAGLIAGSSGFLEIAINQGPAADALGLGVGERVELTLE